MSVESATYINGLNATYPAAGDPKSEGDDHLRLIKSAVKATFPNVAGAVNPTHTEFNYLVGVTSGVQTQLDAKAPLASPTFTGTPAAPTAAATANNTQIATTAMVQSALVAYSGTNLGLPTFSGSDANKSLRLNGSGTGYVWVLEQSATETLSNKTLTGEAMTTVAKGNSGTTTQTYDYSAGTLQTSTATGNHSIAFSNWPSSGKLGVLQIILTNGGAYTITWPTINWIKPDGTTTTSITTYLSALSGRTALQSSGTDQFLFWTVDAGTTVYGKIV